MEPSKLISYVNWDQGERIVHIRHDIAILTRRGSTNEECNIPSRLFPDGLSPHSKGARQTIDCTIRR
jgi:hypothetical protein